MSSRVYVWSGVENVEDLEQYEPGGYHPVHIDEEYQGRYRIVHKLGSGGYSTVWLARDLQANRFVAVKFFIANAKNAEEKIMRHLSTFNPLHPGRHHVVKLLDSFDVQGPNGFHHCLVTEVVGPSVGQIKNSIRGNLLPLAIAKRVASQCVQGLAFIHSCGIVHGDFHYHNILFALPDFHLWSIKDVYEHFGQPQLFDIEREDGQPLTTAAPRYIVRDLGPSRLRGLVLQENCNIKITDFGESFHITEQKPQAPGTPMALAAPEITFDDNIGPAVDVWSLACTLYEVLSFRSLFSSFESEEDEIIVEMVRLLGKLPRRWWNQWGARSTFFEENGAFKLNSGDSSGQPRTVGLRERLGAIRVRAGDQEGQRVLSRDLYALEVTFGRMLRYEPHERIRIEEVVLPF